MKVAFHKSIGAKLFYLTTGLVLVAVAVNSWQNGAMFRNYLERNIEDTTVAQARESASTTAAIVESWVSQIAMTMHGMKESSADERAKHLSNVLGSNRELVAFHLIDATPGRAAASLAYQQAAAEDARFEDQTPAAVGSKLRQLTLSILPPALPTPAATGGQSSSGLIVANLSPAVGLPLLALGMPFTFATKDGSATYWAVMVVWHTRLSGMLPQSKYVTSRIIDGEGRQVTSSDARFLFGAEDFQTAGIRAVAVAAKGAALGFKVFQDQAGTEWLGAHAPVPQTNLLVVVQRNAKTQHMAINAIIQRTALYGWFFVLIAVLASFFGASGLTRHVREVTRATARIAEGDFSATVPLSSGDEVGVLGQSVNTMAQRIKTLLASEITRTRIEAELATASMVQSSFFPRTPLAGGALFVGGDYRPATECGGDWWCHYRDEDGRDFICIADATGHGTGAAFVTAMAYASTVTASKILGRGAGLMESPGSFLARFNDILYESFGGEMAMTFFAACFDARTGTLTYANAGHPFPIVIPQSAGDQRLAKSTMSAQPRSFILKPGGVPLGIGKQEHFKEQVVTLKAGDKIIFYTDGLIECTNAAGDMYGKRRMQKLCEASAELDAVALCTQVMGQTQDFFGTTPRADDVTFIVAELDRNWQPQVAADKDAPAA